MSTAFPWQLARQMYRVLWADAPVNSQAANANRFLLWVDSVGGFLVCRSDKVVLGQAVPGSMADVPLLADLSRQHATIRRDAGGYLLEPIREVAVGGHKVTTATWLADGSVIELGGAVRMKFRRPHPLSATARLDFISHHRTQPLTTAVLLMAETCVLGPGERSHVVCRRWSRDVVLHRQADDLFCRTDGSMEIDGKACKGRGQVSLHSRIGGGDFSFSLEPI